MRWVLAETLIVVVGVLIALGVDNWRQSRSEHRTEEQYLQSLLQDLENDFAQLDRASAAATRTESAARTVLAVTRGEAPELPADSLAYAVEYAGYLSFPGYFPYTFDELVSTGNLQVIRDRDLRRAIAEYYNVIEAEQLWWDRYRGVQATYTQVMQGTLGPDIRGRVMLDQPAEVSEQDRLRILRELSSRPALPAALEGMIWLQGRQLRWHRVNRAFGERLRERITTTLDITDGS